MKDHSDWWSINNEHFHAPELKAQNKDIAPANFQIVGVTLGSHQFEKAAAKLGKAETVQRGDASTGREQVCYVSARAGRRVHLVFEFAELESTFYLFAGGAGWKGANLCVLSSKVSSNTSTASGLRLGLMRSEVEAILGKPDGVYGDKVVYSREVTRRTTPAEFERLRKESGEQLSDKAAHEKFDFYPAEVYIEARFANSKLNYLAVSESSLAD